MTTLNIVSNKKLIIDVKLAIDHCILGLKMVLEWKFKIQSFVMMKNFLLLNMTRKFAQKNLVILIIIIKTWLR